VEEKCWQLSESTIPWGSSHYKVTPPNTSCKKKGQTIDKFLVPVVGNQTQSARDLEPSEEQRTDHSSNVQSEMFVVVDTEDMENISEDVTKEIHKPE
jgi:hypothetical protein